jgi:hypothetical protein
MGAKRGKLFIVHTNTFSNRSNSVFNVRRRGMARVGNRTALGLLTGIALVVACDRSASPGRSEPAVQPGNNAPPTDSARPPAGTGWRTEAGSFLILPTVDGGTSSGSLIRPEATDSTVEDTTGVGRAVGNGVVDLFTRAGKVGEARMLVTRAEHVEPGCSAWPVARLSGDGTGAIPHGWTAAFAKGKVTAVPLDSIEGLPPRDSAALAVNLTRLASALADDTVATFRGLPFVVLRAWRARNADASFVVALLVRRVNQEDAPREERLVMVADATESYARNWKVSWTERASGREDELVVAEPLLAFTFAGQDALRLLFGRDDGEALSAALLVHDARGWHMQWESALAGCEH